MSDRRLVAFLGALSLLTGTAASAEEGKARTFELAYEATVTDIGSGARVLEVWLPYPQSDANQTVHRVTIETPTAITIASEPRFDNQYASVRIENPKASARIALKILATRRENAGLVEPLSEEQRTRDLAAEPLVPVDGPIHTLAVDAIQGVSTDEAKARAIYDKVTRLLKYDKTGTGWGRGDALFACDAKRGNCTDFHALLIGMSRSVGIPARFAIGLPLPEARGEGEIKGYHCWAEMYVSGKGWIPVDSSEASKNPSKHDYFFGHHDENRLELSRGRHLRLEPPQQGSPVNFFVFPYAEVDGVKHERIQTTVRFRDTEDFTRTNSSR
jgi:transglutaminase-like putative cysteine protease